jgi:hypothetical protein
VTIQLKKSYQFSFLKIPISGTGGRWNLFQKAAKSCHIAWNGSMALKCITGQPQKSISVATDVFSACTVPSISGLGAFYNL